MPAFDLNEFKRLVKAWIASHPHGCSSDLRDYCEDLIPANVFTANAWLVDETVAWYQHILDLRIAEKEMAELGEEVFD